MKKLCIGNLSDDGPTSEAEKTELFGNIYDFIADYEKVTDVKAIYDMHRYLMIKHDITPYIYSRTKFFRMYKMWLINLAISLFSLIKTKALECVSVVNQKCMPRPKILDVNEDVKILWLDYVFLTLLQM